MILLQVAVLLLCTEDDNSCYRNVCKMSVVSFALAVVFIIRLFSTSAFRVRMIMQYATFSKNLNPRNIDKIRSVSDIRFKLENCFRISLSS